MAPLAMATAAIVASLLGTVIAACAHDSQAPSPANSEAPDDPYREARRKMVATQIESRGVSNRRVLQAMREVPRHRFVPAELERYAHLDRPLRIGLDQTISQPYIVALMTELIRPRREMKVLEVGTGSGYQAAVLGKLVDQVYSIEILAELGRQARRTLDDLGFDNVHTRIGDGFDGWPEQAPFDAIVVTAAPPEIPRPLLDQLAPGGRLVIPVGEQYQELVVVRRTDEGLERRTVLPVRFVPMTGKAERDGD